MWVMLPKPEAQLSRVLVRSSLLGRLGETLPSHWGKTGDSLEKMHSMPNFLRLIFLLGSAP